MNVLCSSVTWLPTKILKAEAVYCSEHVCNRLPNFTSYFAHHPEYGGLYYSETLVTTQQQSDVGILLIATYQITWCYNSEGSNMNL
jgi:hypothetical protein